MGKNWQSCFFEVFEDGDDGVRLCVMDFKTLLHSDMSVCQNSTTNIAGVGEACTTSLL
jgi:hypothetical protein